MITAQNTSARRFAEHEDIISLVSIMAEDKLKLGEPRLATPYQRDSEYYIILRQTKHSNINFSCYFCKNILHCMRVIHTEQVIKWLYYDIFYNVYRFAHVRMTLSMLMSMYYLLLSKVSVPPTHDESVAHYMMTGLAETSFCDRMLLLRNAAPKSSITGGNMPCICCILVLMCAKNAKRVPWISNRCFLISAFFKI